MADINGKYLSDKYKHQSHIAHELSKKLYAGATGSPLVSSCKNNGVNNTSSPRCSRRRISGIAKIDSSAVKNKNGFVLHSTEKDKPSDYLATVLKSNTTESSNSVTPCKHDSPNALNTQPTSTPMSSNKLPTASRSMKKKPRNDSFSHHKPAEIFRKDLISAMKIPDSTPMPADEYWVMQDPWKMDWEKGVQVPVNPGALPKLNCRKIRDVTKGAYKMPRKMIKSSPDVGDRETVDMNVVADTMCRYDLDEVDVAWLDVSNQERRRQGIECLDEDRMEIIMEELETQCHENLQLAMRTKEGLGIEYDEDIVCDVCRSPDCEEGNEMVFCDGCNLCVHQACYGIVKVPNGNWLCKPCALGIRGSAECILCGKKGGAMKSTRTGQKWAHVSCALWIPEISIADPERMEPITKVSHIPTSRWALICSVCKARIGACIQCTVKNCVTAYHVTCAIENRFDMSTDYQAHSPQPGSLAYGSDGQHSDRERPVVFKSFCRKHSKHCRKISQEELEKSEEQKRSERQKRIEEFEQDFYSLVKCEGVVSALKIPNETALFVMEYWKLKRRANFNRPLITPKQDESKALEEAAETGLQRRLRMFTHLRQDLERVRNLCYMIGRREKLKRTLVKNMENVYLAQMKVIEQQMSHDKNFYPSTLLPTLPTFGNQRICDDAKEETAILKLSKEWGGTEETYPPTPSTVYSNESSPNSPSSLAKVELEVKNEPHCNLEPELLTSVDKVKAIPPEQRSNIGFGLRSKQHQTLMKKETDNKNMQKNLIKSASPKGSSKPATLDIKESCEKLEGNKSDDNKKIIEKINDIDAANTVTEKETIASISNKTRTRNRLKSNELIKEKHKDKELNNVRNEKKQDEMPSPNRRRLRSNASSRSESSSTTPKPKSQTRKDIKLPEATPKPKEDEINKPDAKPTTTNKRKLNSPNSTAGSSSKKPRCSNTVSSTPNEGYQLSLRSSASSPASLNSENTRVTRSKVGSGESKPSTPINAANQNEEKNKSKNEVGALADLCSNSGDSESSGWDDNLSMLSKQELSRNQQHHTTEDTDHMNTELSLNVVHGHNDAPILDRLKQDVKSEASSLRWVPLDGDDDSEDEFQQSLHIPPLRLQDNTGTNFMHSRQSPRRRSSNSIIPATKTLRLDSSEEEDELLLPWKSKLKRRKQLESISNLEDVKKSVVSPQTQKLLSVTKKVTPSPKAKNAMAVGSMLPEQKYAHDLQMLPNAPSVDGSASISQNFSSPQQQQFFSPLPPPYPYQVPFPLSRTAMAVQQNEPKHFHYFNHPLNMQVERPSPPPLPDSTLSPESALPTSLSVAVQATQSIPAVLPPGDPTVMDILQYTSESDNEWEVITNPISVSEVEECTDSPYESYTKSKKKKKRRKKKKKKHKRKRVYYSSSSDHNPSSDEEAFENSSETPPNFKSVLNESPGKLLLKIDKKTIAEDSADEDADYYISSEDFQTDNVPLDEKQLETHKLLTQQTAPRLKFKFTLSKTNHESQESQDAEDLESRYVLSTVKELPKIKKPRVKKPRDVSNDEAIAIGRRSLRERVEPDKKNIEKVPEAPVVQIKVRTNKKPLKMKEKSQQDEELFRKIVQSKLRTVHMREVQPSKKKIRPNKRPTRSDMIQSNIGVVKSEVMQQNSSSSSPEREKFMIDRSKIAKAMSSVLPPVRHWKKRKVYEHQHSKFITAPINSIAEALSNIEKPNDATGIQPSLMEDSVTEEMSTAESTTSIPPANVPIAETKDPEVLPTQQTSTVNNPIEAS